MPGGKSEAGSTEWKIEVILPVCWDMTIVAAVSRPSMTARDEARTVIRGCMAGGPKSGGVVAGVGYGWIVSDIDMVAAR